MVDFSVLKLLYIELDKLIPKLMLVLNIIYILKIKKPHFIISFTISNKGCSLLSASKTLNDIFQTENSSNTIKDSIKKALNILVNGEFSIFSNIFIKFKLFIFCATLYNVSIVENIIFTIPMPMPLNISNTPYLISLLILNTCSILPQCIYNKIYY